METEEDICPICEREMPKESYDMHHLIPKTFKGKETIKIHKICHSKIHSLFTERELLNTYHTIESLVSHDEIIKFVKWVSGKDPQHYSKNKRSNRRKR